MQHQAHGLQQLFSGQGAVIVSVLAGPSATPSHEFVLELAAALSHEDYRLLLVETGAGKLCAAAGCRPLKPWQVGRPLKEQIVQAGSYGLLHAPEVMAGDASLINAVKAQGQCDFVLFDGGRFSKTAAPLEPSAEQFLIVLLGKEDAEAGYALVKALNTEASPARVLLVGGPGDRVAQTASFFLNRPRESAKSSPLLSQNDNSRAETSSNTLSFGPNLTWVVSRIIQNDQPKVAHGGSSNSAEKVYDR